MAIVGGHERHAHFPRERDQLGQHLLLFGQAVILNFDKIIALAEDFQVLFHGFARSLAPAVEQKLWKLAGNAGGQRDQTFGVSPEQIIVHARLIIKTARKALAHQLGQVVIALIVFRQQN